MRVSFSVQYNNNATRELIKKNALFKQALIRGTAKAVDELSEIGMAEIRKSQSYHATEKLPTKITGTTIKGGYINRTKGILYAEFGTGAKAIARNNPYQFQHDKKVWFTQNTRAAKYMPYYKRRITRTGKYAGSVYYVVFPQKAQRRFFFAKKKILQRKPAVVKRNVLHALREAGK